MTPVRPIVPVDAGFLVPGQHGVTDEFGAVVGDDQAGFATPRDNRRQFPRHTPARDRRVRNGAQTFLGDIVDDIEDARRPDLVQ